MPARSAEAARGRAAGAALAAFFAPHRLSAGHRRVADRLVRDAPGCLFLSAAEVASRAGVSQPTVTRLAQAVGFDGYATLQSHLRSLMLEPPAPPVSPANPYRLVVRRAVDDLEALDARLEDPADLRSLAEQLYRSVPLVVLSVRVAAPVASYFAYFAARILPDVRPLNGGGSTTLDGLSQARQAGARWVLCFLLPRYPQEVVAALSFAREIGLRVAVVTDRPAEPVRRLADVVVATGTNSTATFGSLAAPIVYAGVLLQALADVDPRRTRSRLAAFERMVAGQNVFYGG